ncbi:MAG TPA: N-6 DNA methylase [Patescibacteria group bacterium]|nr:N-6 DNA methylase [Patescibacteria group bacterium]
MPIRNVTAPKTYQELFARLEELVLANSGADEFEEIFKLIFAKLYDEIECKGQRFKIYDTPKQTYREVSGLLAESLSKWVGIFPPGTKIELDAEHLDVCVEVMKGYSLSKSGLQVMDDAFEHLVAKASKGSKGQFFTPRHVIDFCIKMVAPTKDEYVCDPACGSGAFLFHTLQYLFQDLKSQDSNLLKDYSYKYLWGFDYESKAARVAKALMLIAGDGSTNIYRLNSLHKDTKVKLKLTSSEATQISIEDILKIRLPKFPGFDVILTNPPYAGEIKQQELLDEYFVSNLVGNRVERDTLFLERCIELLKPGGRMAIVVPDNKVSGKAFDELRKWLFDMCKIDAVIGLPRTTFMPHTSQKTSILFLRKRNAKEKGMPNEPIFFGISENIGKDSRGKLIYKGQSRAGSAWDDVDHDLGSILSEYMIFTGVHHGKDI